MRRQGIVNHIHAVAAALALSSCAREEEPLPAETAPAGRLETATFALG